MTIVKMYATLLVPIIAGIINSVFCKSNLLLSLKVPIDGGKKLKDGKRIFGDNKTIKGFLGYIVFNIIVSMVLSALMRLTAGSAMFNIFRIIEVVYSLAVLIPGLAVAWRRLHDIGRSGAWYLLMLVPFVGVIVLLVWFCKDSQPGVNEYGPCPKDFDQYSSY